MGDKNKTVVNETVPVQPEGLSVEDKHALELAKMNRKLALAQAEKALAENNGAENAFKYLVLQLYMKYGLNEADAIDENGVFHRNKSCR